MVEIINKTAVTLDPVYTLKGVRGLLGELRNNPASFDGNRILYIHTGELILCVYPHVHTHTQVESLGCMMEE